MEMNSSQNELAEYYTSVSPNEMSNDELAYAVIYSLTSMEYYDISDDDEADDDSFDENDEDIGQDEENDDTSEMDDAFYEASFLFWQKRCKEFQFELWQRGFEALRLHLYADICIPVLQQRGYHIPIEMLVSNFCKKCSIEQLEALINRLAMENNEEAYAAAAPFVAERQMRLN